MLIYYRDILELTNKEPDWWDCRGVPRFYPFDPTLLGVYDKMALLVEIRCQACNKVFLIGEGWTRFDPFFNKENNLKEMVTGYSFGDPPVHLCIGDTMNSVAFKVIEAWEKTYETDTGLPLQLRRTPIRTPIWKHQEKFEGANLKPRWYTEV